MFYKGLMAWTHWLNETAKFLEQQGCLSQRSCCWLALVTSVPFGSSLWIPSFLYTLKKIPTTELQFSSNYHHHFHLQESRGERDGEKFLHLISLYSPSLKKFRVGTWMQELRQKPWREHSLWASSYYLTQFASSACSVCFIKPLRTISPGLSPHQGSWTLPHQSWIKI